MLNHLQTAEKETYKTTFGPLQASLVWQVLLLRLYN